MPFGREGAIQVHGLAELQRALREVDSQLPKELRKTNLAAADLVAKEARQKAQQQGGVARHVEPSIKAAAQQRSASVAWGGAKYPMAGGAEFGSTRYKQFKPFNKSGYFVYPAVASTREPFMEVYATMIDELTRLAFPGVGI